MKWLQIPQKLVYKIIYVPEQILSEQNCCWNLSKIYFLKNAKKIGDLNRDWIIWLDCEPYGKNQYKKKAEFSAQTIILRKLTQDNFHIIWMPQTHW